MASWTGTRGVFRMTLANRSGFKFPLKTDLPAQSPTAATTVGAASASGVATDSAVRSNLPDEAPASVGSATVDESGAIQLREPPAPVSEEPDTTVSPVTPIVTVTPPAESTEHLPLQADAEEPHRASTIDQAIAKFNEAVGKPKDEEESANEATGAMGAITPVEEITAALDADEVDEAAEPATEAAHDAGPIGETAGVSGAEEGADTRPVEANGAAPENSDDQEDTLPSTDASTTMASPPFRRHPSADKQQAAKADEAVETTKDESDAEGEGQTLDEIDLS
jgi:hypothetical protein